MFVLGSSGSHNSPRGYGAGWDIILPSGWAMPFWMALIYRGARAVGLKESRACAFEKFEPCFPRDFPDTAAGRAHNESLRMDGEEKFNKYPPAKRPNYHKLGEWRRYSLLLIFVSGIASYTESYQASKVTVFFGL